MNDGHAQDGCCTHLQQCLPSSCVTIDCDTSVLVINREYLGWRVILPRTGLGQRHEQWGAVPGLLSGCVQRQLHCQVLG